MIEFLFGWLIKPEILQTPLDSIILLIEFFVFAPIILVIMYWIDNLFRKGRNKKDDR